MCCPSCAGVYLQGFERITAWKDARATKQPGSDDEEEDDDDDAVAVLMAVGLLLQLLGLKQRVKSFLLVFPYLPHQQKESIS